MRDISQLDWARLAAYIDGEGSIYITIQRPKDSKARAHRYNQLTVSVANTDVRLPLWCRETFGIGCINRNCTNAKQGKGWKNGITWRVCSRQAEWIIRGCLPYFIIKREQAEVALAYRATFKHRGGHDHITPEEKQQREDAYIELKRLKHEHPEPEVIQ